MENVRWKTDLILRSSAISAKKLGDLFPADSRRLPQNLTASTLCPPVNAVVNNGKCNLETDAILRASVISAKN